MVRFVTSALCHFVASASQPEALAMLQPNAKLLWKKEIMAVENERFLDRLWHIRAQSEKLLQGMMLVSADVRNIEMTSIGIEDQPGYVRHSGPGTHFCNASIALSDAASDNLGDCQLRCDAMLKCAYVSFWMTGGANWCRLDMKCDKFSQQKEHRISIYKKPLKAQKVDVLEEAEDSVDVIEAKPNDIDDDSGYVLKSGPGFNACDDGTFLSWKTSNGFNDCKSRCDASLECDYFSFWDERNSWCGLAKTCKTFSRQTQHTISIYKKAKEVDVPKEAKESVDMAEARKVDSPPSVFIGYESAASYHDRRDRIRQNCLPNLAAAGFNIKFYVGRPSDPEIKTPNQQGTKPTEWEQAVAKELIEEQNEYGDIVVLPMRDHYRDLTDKTAQIFLHGLVSGAKLILKIDDDMCPCVKSLQKQINSTDEGSLRYVGHDEFNVSENQTMSGANVMVAPYFSGSCYALSHDLAQRIYDDDLSDNMLFARFGTIDEDANTGRFIKRAEADAVVSHVQEAELCSSAKHHAGKGL